MESTSPHIDGSVAVRSADFWLARRQQKQIATCGFVDYESNQIACATIKQSQALTSFLLTIMDVTEA
jgi:hypothetical protein